MSISETAAAIWMDVSLRTGAGVALFPEEYPVFADWKDYRSV
jgi:hypothetical protein